jgi:hypothetical protein
MIKWLLSGSVLIVLVVLGVPAVASAHVLKVDGHIGGILHINPDDNPTTGGSTEYDLSFDDDTDHFSLAKCDCQVSIIENGQTISRKPLNVSSNEVSEDRYTFVKPDVYTLRFTGRPKVIGAFQSFMLDYEIRVSDGRSSQQHFPVSLWLGMGMGAGLLLLAAYTTNYGASELNEEGK